VNADATQNIAKTRANFTVLNIFRNYHNLAPLDEILDAKTPNNHAIDLSLST
jgi:hypothetical protein